jgi:hypothetical protein
MIFALTRGGRLFNRSLERTRGAAKALWEAICWLIIPAVFGYFDLFS